MLRCSVGIVLLQHLGLGLQGSRKLQARVIQDTAMTTLNIDDAKIRETAYLMWLDEGQPEGRDQEHWLKAIDALTPATPKAKAKRKAPAKAKAAPKAKAKSKPKAKKSATAK